MGSLVRILALAGVVLIGMGAVVPATVYSGPACTLPGGGGDTFLDPDCYEDDIQAGFEATHIGIILIAVAVFGLIPAFKARAVALWSYSLSALGLIAVLYLYLDAQKTLAGDLIVDYNWAWGTMLGGGAMLVLAALAATIRASRRTSL